MDRRNATRHDALNLAARAVRSRGAVRALDRAHRPPCSGRGRPRPHRPQYGGLRGAPRDREGVRPARRRGMIQSGL